MRPVFNTTLRLSVAVLAVTSTASCSIFAPLFGGGGGSEDVSVYQSAMADFSLCETASTASDRAAAAARLSAAARSMSATSLPTNPDHFFEMDRVVAANSQCQAIIAAR